MREDGVLTGAALEAAELALAQGRLFWRVSDQYGRSANGGDRSFRLEHAVEGQPEHAVEGQPGPWASRIEDVALCSRGYHATTDPVCWAGCLVTLVEVDEVADRDGDKVVCHTLRALGQAVPWACVDRRLWVAMSRPNLTHANLTHSDTRARGAFLAGGRQDG